MDGQRFDNLTRLVASSLSRRAALKAALGAVVARGLPSPSLAAQSSCPIFDACDPDGLSRCIVLEDADGSCVCAFRPMAKSAICDGPTCQFDADCSEGVLCAVGWCGDGLGRCHGGCDGQGGVDRCGEGQSLCGSRCVDLLTDLFHCGECDHQCGFGGDQVGEICVDAQCVCPPEYTGSCGQDYCTNELMDGNNCGACGNQCESGQICCGGRCASRDDAERFCEFCGYLSGWPQDCLANEVCDRGLCVSQDPSMPFSQAVVVVTCPEPPQIEHHYDTSDAEVYLDSWEAWGCHPVNGGTVEAWSVDGQLISTCTIENGICIIEGTYGELPITLIRTNTPSDAELQLDWGDTLDESNVGWRMALVYVQPDAASSPT